MIILFNLELVHWLEVVLQNLYAFFVHKLKKFLEFQELVDFINIKGNKFLRNVKTQWVSMFFLAKWVYVKYRPLIIKMHVESSKNDHALKNLHVMCDVELLLVLPCIIPLLECVHMLITISQGRDVFV